jgi:hypothetical protein
MARGESSRQMEQIFFLLLSIITSTMPTYANVQSGSGDFDCTATRTLTYSWILAHAAANAKKKWSKNLRIQAMR